MLLGCGCLLAMMAGVAPRLVLIIMWIFGNRISLALSPIITILGIIFLPYTTIMYVLVWGPGGIIGWDWVWIGFGTSSGWQFRSPLPDARDQSLHFA